MKPHASAPWLRMLLAGVFVVPLAAAIALGLAQAFQPRAWSGLWHDTQWLPAWHLSLWVGLGSTALSAALVWWLVPRLHGTRGWQRVQRWLGSVLAVPHVAFAVGFALLVMPSGWVARLVAPLAGWDAPPAWVTVQDPWAAALVIALVCKEVPFLLWNVAALLTQAGEGARLQQQRQVCASMGYGVVESWRHVLWPQLLPRLAWPLAAVLAYGLTVVDMALILGPTTPPTLAVLAWQWLLDPDPAMQGQGGAAVCLLSLTWVVVMALAWVGARGMGRLLGRWRTAGVRHGRGAGSAGQVAAGWGAVLYAGVALALLFVSWSGVWSFPSLLPQVWSGQSWALALSSGGSLWSTLVLALTSTAVALVLVVAWMESSSVTWDRAAAPWLYATMVLPSLLLSLGLYRLALHVGADGTWPALWWTHTMFVAPYVWVSLAPAYRGYDERYRWTALSLGRGSAAHLLRVKWPVLRAPIAAAMAVGFAVSVAQYLPTQFVGAGRVATVTTEAVTLASGGQRSMLAAFAALQAVLPLLAFAAAAAVGRRVR